MVSQLSLLDWAGLAATAAGAALLYTLTGFGFAVLSTPAFLLFVDPPQAIQLVIIISTALSITTLPGLWRAIAPALLLRLTLGSIAGLPLGLIALRHADPVVVRRLIGATILAFALVLGWVRLRGPGRHTALLGMRPSRDLAIGAISGTATALVGMAGPPVLIYCCSPEHRRQPCVRHFSRFSGSSTRQRCSPMRWPSASPPALGSGQVS